jgi:putative sensor protein
MGTVSNEAGSGSPGTARTSGSRSGVDVARGVVLTGLAVWEGLLAVWATICAALVGLGVGVYLLPGALRGTRSEAERQRRLAAAWSGVDVPQSYLPDEHRYRGFTGALRLTRDRLGDGVTWRDLLWLVVNPFVGPFMAFLPALAILNGIWGLVVLAIWRPVVRSWNGSWYLFVPLLNETTAILSAVLGVVSICIGFASRARCSGCTAGGCATSWVGRRRWPSARGSGS